MIETKGFKCSACGKLLPTKSARRVHRKRKHKTINRSPSKDGRMAAFESMAEDLPDGAYWAMAEEFGLSTEDFI